MVCFPLASQATFKPEGRGAPAVHTATARTVPRSQAGRQAQTSDLAGLGDSPSGCERLPNVRGRLLRSRIATNHRTK